MPFLGETSELFGGFSSASGATYVPAGAIWLDGSADYLSFTPASADDTKTWTLSWWQKTDTPESASARGVFGAGTGGGTDRSQISAGDSLEKLNFYNQIDGAGSSTGDHSFGGLIRDTTAWSHYVVVYDSTNGTAANRCIAYKDGVLLDTTVNTAIGSNQVTNVGDVELHMWGRGYVGGAGQFWSGYLADCILVTDVALTATDFGKFDANGNWVPIDPTAAVAQGGANATHWLDFADSAAATYTEQSTTSSNAISNSDYGAGYEDDLAFDNNTGTGWASAEISGGVNGVSWIGYNFSGSGSIEARRFAIQTSDANSTPSSILIEYSDNGSSWTTAETKSLSYTGSLVNVDIGGYGAHSYWRVRANSGVVTNYSFYVREMQIMTLDNSGLGKDVSGNGNTFTATSMSSANSTSDRPADKATDDLGNYCTGNPLFAKNTANDVNTWTEGNTKIAASSTHNGVAKCSIGIPSNATGKWYFEATPNIGANVIYIGLAASNYTRYPSSGTQNLEYRSDNGNKVDETNTSSAYGASYTSGDVIGVEYDADTDTLTFYKNGSSQGAAWTDVSNRLAFPIFPYCFLNNGSGNTFKFNFGATAWTYAPASVQEISTANLPAPTITDPSKYFNTVLYTGNGGTQAITGVGFQPDLVWIKTRNTNTTNHQIYDAVRGATKYVKPNSDGVELTYADTLTSFDSGGFSLGADASSNDCNFSGRTYAAWCLKAGDSNTAVAESGSGNGAINACTHRANTTSGFSIIKYTGFNDTIANGEATKITHGLSQAPDIMIGKNLTTGTTNWFVIPGESGGGSWSTDNHMNLNTTASSSGALFVQPSFPDSSYIYIGNDDLVNKANDEFIMYAWHRVPGLVGYGTYVGNASTDGPYVVVDDGGSGFRPAFTIIKLTGTPVTESGSWHMYDNVRGPVPGANPPKNEIFANLDSAEFTPGNIRLDFTANGFKIRDSVDLNESGKTYIYLAFAEYPFGGEGVAQAKAR